MNSNREKYKAYALSVAEKWSLEEVRSAFVAEYADRRVFLEDKCRLWKHVLTLSGKIGALRKKIKKLEQGNIAKARAIPLKTCGHCQTWKRDGKMCVGTCPHQDGMTAEWMSGCPNFSKKKTCKGVKHDCKPRLTQPHRPKQSRARIRPCRSEGEAE